MTEIHNLSINEYIKALKDKKFSAVDGVKYFSDRIKKDHRNAVIEVFQSATDAAKKIDEKIKKGEKLGKLGGVPILIKDNILYKGHKASAASKMLGDFVSPYSATIVEKMLAEDAIILGRTNMDEFAMGATGETSSLGVTLNSKSDKHVAGGSSSGAASAMAANLCIACIGTDTGGSIRCPAAWNEIYSIKPTYGSISRYGIIAYASGLDQAGPVTKNANDAKIMLDVLRGKDPHDMTSIEAKNTKTAPTKKAGIKIGFIKDVWKHKDTIQGFDRFQKLFDDLKKHGVEIVPLTIKNIDLALAAYYIIAPAEASSNLARFDGVRYTSAPKQPKNLGDLYISTRTENFGDEVKHRINLGNYVLSSGYFDAYYGKAKQVQAALKNEMAAAFEKCDAVILPVTPGDAPKIGEKTTDKIAMYLIDLFTIVANVVGVPSLCRPFGMGDQGLPIGLQIMGAHGHDDNLFEIEKLISEVLK